MTGSFLEVFVDVVSADPKLSFQQPFQKAILTVDVLGRNLNLLCCGNSVGFELPDTLLEFFNVGSTSRAEVALVNTISIG